MGVMSLMYYVLSGAEVLGVYVGRGNNFLQPRLSIADQLKWLLTN